MYPTLTLSTTFALLLAVFQAADADAEAHRDSVASFSHMLKYVEKSKHPERTLVVMDDDDTLTMMSCPEPNKPQTCQYLGGPAWFAWQSSQVKLKAQPRVADTFHELLRAASLLLAINDMAYTADDVPRVLNKLTASGVRLMVETARGNGDISATEHQFADLNVDNKQYPTLLSLISEHSLIFGKEKLSSRAGPYLPCGDKNLQAVSYRQGSMYLSGQNKGSILKCMLDSYNRQENVIPVSHVVFIDDTLENVIDVHEAFQHSKTYTVYALHYTALSEHKKALTQGKMADTYQENAMRRWREIQHTLKYNLQNPVLP